MTVDKSKDQKDAYEKALAAYGQVMKTFRSKGFAEGKKALSAFIEKYPDERELLDRAGIYLSICESSLNPEKISHSSFDEHYLWGVVYLNRKDFAEAGKLLGIAHKQNPGSAKVLYMLALIHHLQKEDEKSLDFLEKAIKLDSSFAVLACNEADFEDLSQDARFVQITETQ